jgi:hypothetical protein
VRWQVKASIAMLVVTTVTAGHGVPSAPTIRSAHSIALPPANGRFDYQIGGSYQPVSSVQIVDRDRTSHPAAGVYNICYINAFQTQADQDHWWTTHHAKLLLHTKSGELVEDPGWAGEILLNTATATNRHALAKIIGGWIDGCAKKGFNAIEPDNLDSNTRSGGRLRTADNFAYAKLLVARAHHDGLAIAQKNDAENSHRGKTQVGFDFAIAEECQVYSECQDYLKAYGNHVIEVEYDDSAAGRAAYTAACSQQGQDISVIERDREVVARGKPGYLYRAC